MTEKKVVSKHAGYGIDHSYYDRPNTILLTNAPIADLLQSSLQVDIEDLAEDDGNEVQDDAHAAHRQQMPISSIDVEEASEHDVHEADNFEQVMDVQLKRCHAL